MQLVEEENTPEPQLTEKNMIDEKNYEENKKIDEIKTESTTTMNPFDGVGLEGSAQFYNNLSSFTPICASNKKAPIFLLHKRYNNSLPPYILTNIYAFSVMVLASLKDISS